METDDYDMDTEDTPAAFSQPLPGGANEEGHAPSQADSGYASGSLPLSDHAYSQSSQDPPSHPPSTPPPPPAEHSAQLLPPPLATTTPPSIETPPTSTGSQETIIAGVFPLHPPPQLEQNGLQTGQKSSNVEQDSYQTGQDDLNVGQDSSKIGSAIPYLIPENMTLEQLHAKVCTCTCTCVYMYTIIIIIIGTEREGGKEGGRESMSCHTVVILCVVCMYMYMYVCTCIYVHSCAGEAAISRI